MKAKHVAGLLCALLGLGAGWLFFNIQNSKLEAMSPVEVSSYQIVTVQDFAALAETSVEIGSSPELGPVVILLGSLHPFTVEVAGEEIRGIEVENNFGVPNSYRIMTTLEDETINIKAGDNITMAVFTNAANGQLVVTPDAAEMQGALWVGYLCAGLLIALGIWTALK